MGNIRRQLTLFANDETNIIELVRAKYNPVQYQLIAAHVTLCREHEMESIDDLSTRLGSIALEKPLSIKFGSIATFADGHGLFLPSCKENESFFALRKSILRDTINVDNAKPHLTLMHPRNSTCTEEIFDQLKKIQFPDELFFDKISLIEQQDGKKWKILDEFIIYDRGF